LEAPRQAADPREENSFGSPLNAQLQRDGLPVASFVTTAQSKPLIIEKLMLAFEQGQIHIPNDPVLVSELQAFECHQTATGVRYGAPVGQHDDCVLSLAIGWNAIHDDQGVWDSWNF
jgi:hypothetical protein